jgi:hypothetical protein
MSGAKLHDRSVAYRNQLKKTINTALGGEVLKKTLQFMPYNFLEYFLNYIDDASPIAPPHLSTGPAIPPNRTLG